MPLDGWPQVRRLLVVPLGDATAPALHALHQALPGAAISLLVAPDAAEAACGLPGVGQVIASAAIWQQSGTPDPDPARERDLIDVLRAGRFDAAVILPHGAISPHPAAYACYLAGISLRLGRSQEFGGVVLAPWLKAGAGADGTLEAVLSMLAAAGLEAGGEPGTDGRSPGLPGDGKGEKSWPVHSAS